MFEPWLEQNLNNDFFCLRKRYLEEEKPEASVMNLDADKGINWI